MSKICKNIIELPTSSDFQLSGVNTKQTEQTVIKTKVGKFHNYDELEDFINNFRQNWSTEKEYFVDQFTKKLRSIVYYQLNGKTFDNFYWFCYSSAKQYLSGFTSYCVDEELFFNPDRELKKWIDDYKKAYPKLPKEAQALVAEQYNKDIVLYQKYGASASH